MKLIILIMLMMIMMFILKSSLSSGEDKFNFSSLSFSLIHFNEYGYRKLQTKTTTTKNTNQKIIFFFFLVFDRWCYVNNRVYILKTIHNCRCRAHLKQVKVCEGVLSIFMLLFFVCLLLLF